MSTPLFPLKGEVSNHKGILDEEKIKDYAFIGELSLDGTLRGVNGVLPLILGLKDAGIKNVFVPAVNAAEAALAGGVNILGANCLADVVNHFADAQIKPVVIDINKYLSEGAKQEYIYDFKKENQFFYPFITFFVKNYLSVDC